MLDKSLLEMTFKLHGHKDPAWPVGIRVGTAAMKALGVERAKNRELYCLCETGVHPSMCFVDGVQFATGCTLGKGNIEKLDYGKNAITVIDVKSKKAVRVSLRPKFQKKTLTSEFEKLRSQGLHPQDIKPEVIDPIIDEISSLPDEEILIVGDVFDVDFKPRKGAYEWYECEKCREIVFAPGVRILDGKHLCIPCSGYRDIKVM